MCYYIVIPSCVLGATLKLMSYRHAEEFAGRERTLSSPACLAAGRVFSSKLTAQHSRHMAKFSFQLTTKLFSSRFYLRPYDKKGVSVIPSGFWSEAFLLTRRPLGPVSMFACGHLCPSSFFNSLQSFFLEFFARFFGVGAPSRNNQIVKPEGERQFHSQVLL